MPSQSVTIGCRNACANLCLLRNNKAFQVKPNCPYPVPILRCIRPVKDQSLIPWCHVQGVVAGALLHDALGWTLSHNTLAKQNINFYKVCLTKFGEIKGPLQVHQDTGGRGRVTCRKCFKSKKLLSPKTISVFLRKKCFSHRYRKCF